MRKKVKGSVTIEATVVVPLILFVLGTLFYTLFYYHDKNVLLVGAHETAVYGVGREQQKEMDLENHFRSGVEGRLLLFQQLQPKVEVSNKQVTVFCVATKSPMVLQVECKMNRTEPETYIRTIRKIKKLGEKGEKTD